MTDKGAFETVASYLWPAGPILTCLAASSLLLVLRRRGTRSNAQRVLGTIAGVSGAIVALQTIWHGWPTVLWIALGGILVWHLDARRPPQASFRREMFNAVRNALIAATGGVVIVVGMQVVLAYQTDGHAERVLHWNRQIAMALSWLERVVFLGPVKLAMLLIGSIAIVTFAMPALHMVRSYRRFANTMTHCLLALTVATSFTFFTGRHAPGWQRDWVARQGNEIGSQMEELKKRNEETLALVAIAEALRATPPAAKIHFHVLARSVEQHVDREAIWKRITDRWHGTEPLAPITERIQRAQVHLHHAPPANPEAHGVAEALDRLQRVRSVPDAVTFADLDVLGVQRSAAAAAHAEAKGAVREVLGEIVLGETLMGQLLKGLLGHMRSRPAPVRAVVDVKSLRTTMSAGAGGPPSVSFDLIGVSLNNVPEDVAAREIELKVANIAQGIATERAANAARAMREAEERRRWKELELIQSAATRGSVERTRPRREGPDIPERPSIPPARAISTGRRGGGSFGIRRRDRNALPPIRLVA